jgi:hypothetical protein
VFVAIADPPLTRLAAAALESVQAYGDLLAQIREIRTVQKIGQAREGLYVALWVLLAEEDLDDMEKIYLLERETRRRAGALPLKVHVVALNRVNEQDLPETRTIFAR